MQSWQTSVQADKLIAAKTNECMHRLSYLMSPAVAVKITGINQGNDNNVVDVKNAMLGATATEQHIFEKCMILYSKSSPLQKGRQRQSLKHQQPNTSQL
jgi:hypothetical protein